jgi:hypothetical protein
MHVAHPLKSNQQMLNKQSAVRAEDLQNRLWQGSIEEECCGLSGGPEQGAMGANR